MKPVVRENDVKKYFDKVRRTLQIERIAKDNLLSYLFVESKEHREEVSLKELAHLIFSKFMLDQN
jgi:hypothetical protein